MRRIHSRSHPRWTQQDYRLPGMYFITTLTLGRIPLLGALRCGECALSTFGLIVRRVWQDIPQRFPGVELDTFVVMPDHVHALVAMPEHTAEAGTSLSDVARWAKSRSAHEINVMRGTLGARIWQASFHDRIVRTPDARERIRRYIELNPRRG